MISISSPYFERWLVSGMLVLGCVAGFGATADQARLEPKSDGPTVPSGRSGREATRGRAIRFPGTVDVPDVSILASGSISLLNGHGAASCRFATRPVLRTRPGHPTLIQVALSRSEALSDQEQPATPTSEATVPAEPPSKELSPEEKAALAEGQALFRGLCSGCHGGLGRGGKGPDLTDNRWLHGDKDEDIKRVIQNGVPGTTMKKLGESLKEQQITLIIAYVRSLARAPGDSNWKPYMAGDLKVGEQLFFDEKSKTPCSKCHTVNRKGGRVGPALDRIAARRSPEFIMESIVTPSKFIDPLFEAVSVATREGKVIVGLRINETNFSIQLREENGRFHSLLKRDLDEFRVMDKSLMPENIPEQMTVKQLHDLFAFLMTLE